MNFRRMKRIVSDGRDAHRHKAALRGLIGAASIGILFCAAIEGAFAAAPASTPAGPASAANPSSPSSPSNTGSGAAIEAQVLAFQGVDAIAAHIRAKICASESVADGATIVIYDQNSFASLAAFEAFIANIKVMTGSYKTLIPDLKWLRSRLEELAAARQKADAVAADKGAMSKDFADHLQRRRELLNFAYTATGDPGSDFVSLLSAIAVSANAETPNAVTIPDSSIAVALTPLLTKPKDCGNHQCAFKVIYPPLFGSGSASDYSSADIDLNIQILEDIRQAAHEVVRNSLTKDGANNDLNGFLTKTVNDIDGLYDSFMNSLLQANAGAGVAGSAAVIQGYRLATLLKDQSTHTLLATVVGSGGTEHDHKTFWTALGSGDKLTYSGGLIVNVAMWKSSDGTPEISEVMEYKTAFVDADGAVDKY
jgi:hypothetical protein